MERRKHRPLAELSPGEKKIAAIFRRARIKKKLTLAVLTRVLGLPYGYRAVINRFENGLRGISRKRFNLLAEYLDIGITYDEYLAGILPNEKRHREVVCKRCMHINKVEIRD